MLRLISQFVISVVVGLIAADFATWVYLRIYADRFAMPLHHLSDDYGMGFDAMILGIAVFLATAIGLLAHLLHRTNKERYLENTSD